jgi:hypothetical protein
MMLEQSPSRYLKRRGAAAYLKQMWGLRLVRILSASRRATRRAASRAKLV